MTKDEALDRKAENARQLGLNYETECTHEEDDEFARIEHENQLRNGQPYHFDIYVSPSQRNHVLEEVARQIDAMPFGDTAASFACFVRNMKGQV